MEPKNTNYSRNWAHKFLINEELHDITAEIATMYIQLSYNFKENTDSKNWFDISMRWAKYNRSIKDLVLSSEEIANKEIQNNRVEYRKVKELTEFVSSKVTTKSLTNLTDENQHTLSDERLADIYKNEVKPTIIDGIAPCEDSVQPVAVFLGGQPGSGKSLLGEVAINQLSNKSAVVIDTDKLRMFHPNSKHATEHELYHLDKYASFKWQEMLINDCIDTRRNIIFDGTLGRSIARLEDKMINLKEHGYFITASVLAINDTISRLGIQDRYETMHQAKGQGRSVDLIYHDDAYTKIPINLQALASKARVDKFDIYGQDFKNDNLKKISSYSTSQIKMNPSAPAIDLANGRRITS